MAGFNIDGQPPNPDEEYSYDLYKMFEIEFENPPSKFYPSHSFLIKKFVDNNGGDSRPR